MKISDEKTFLTHVKNRTEYAAMLLRNAHTRLNNANDDGNVEVTEITLEAIDCFTQAIKQFDLSKTMPHPLRQDAFDEGLKFVAKGDAAMDRSKAILLRKN